MKLFGRVVVIGLVVFGLLQLARPRIPAKTAAAEIQAPPQVRQILRNDCYSCHSDERRLAWFDQIVPGYWLVRHDILIAREHLNFSTLGSQPAPVQRATLFEAVNMIQLGAMPLPSFRKLHPEAKVTPEDLATLKAYLAPWTPAPNPPPAQPVPAIALASVKPEFNSFPFDPSFETWKPISTTDRGDNNTFRFILANDIAVKAAQSGNITPWPDGARFAKIAWQQTLGADGLMHPGDFVQVELMVKDAARYKHTEGWGWGRWRGLNLMPYGKSAHFATECTSCHLPMRGNDYVYTLPLTQARVIGNEVVNHTGAALPSNLPWQPLTWNAITMDVDRSHHTTSTLYGNETAMKALRARSDAPARPPAYPAGAVLALVTWAQRDDPHWFGARIPDTPQAVEFLQVATAGQASRYRRFDGPRLTEDPASTTDSAQRTTFIVGLPPASLP
jgi:mono/diheme cytochrome c family protein